MWLWWMYLFHRRTFSNLTSLFRLQMQKMLDIWCINLEWMTKMITQVLKMASLDHQTCFEAKKTTKLKNALSGSLFHFCRWIIWLHGPPSYEYFHMGKNVQKDIKTSELIHCFMLKVDQFRFSSSFFGKVGIVNISKPNWSNKQWVLRPNHLTNFNSQGNCEASDFNKLGEMTNGPVCWSVRNVW